MDDARNGAKPPRPTFQGAGIHDNSDAFTETNITISGNDVSGGTGNGIPIQVANMRWRCQPMAT